MEDRIALVTGSSRGIGRDIALRLAETVGSVAVHYFSQRQDALGVVENIRQKGTRSVAFRADLSNEKSANLLIQRVQDRFGRLDILINNFGPILVKP
ncbi:MAG: SDR family NAD(P)-dependent oxidoreductase, partial [Candidatus Aminicenantaceae bacterium]